MTSNERLAYAVADYIWGFVTTCMMVLLVYLMGHFAIYAGMTEYDISDMRVLAFGFGVGWWVKS